MFKGDAVGAMEIFEKTVTDNHWPGFGCIASEVELYRNKSKSLSRTVARPGGIDVSSKAGGGREVRLWQE